MIFSDNSTAMRRLFPELRMFADQSERRTTWRRALWSIYLDVRAWIVLGGTIVMIEVAHQLSIRYLPVIWRAVAPLLCVVALTVVGGSAMIWIARNRIQRQLRRRLQQLGVKVCIECGYELEHIESSVCPECGVTIPVVTPR